MDSPTLVNVYPETVIKHQAEETGRIQRRELKVRLEQNLAAQGVDYGRHCPQGSSSDSTSLASGYPDLQLFLRGLPLTTQAATACWAALS